MSTSQFLESVVLEHTPGDPPQEHDQSTHGRKGAGKKELGQFEFSDSLRDDLDFIEFGDDTTPELVRKIFDHYEVEPVTFIGKPLRDIYQAPDGTIVEWDGKGNYFSITDPDEMDQFIYEADIGEQTDEYEDRLSDEFWDSPGPVFHATDSENLEAIKVSGIHASSDTRGMSNRHVGSAVYTTAEWDEAKAGHYGDLVIEIDTVAMKRDGVTPYVAQEPDIVRGEMLGALAHALSNDRFHYDFESGMSPNTLVFSGDIPAKYLKFHE